MNIDRLVAFDIECYLNYLLIMFKRIATGQVISFQKFNDSEIDIASLSHIVSKYTLVSFNGIKYDSPVMSAVISGADNATIHFVGDTIIKEQLQAWQTYQRFGLPTLDEDHIDLIEVAPLKASLKIYGGRIDAPKMQDLPIEPGSIILESQTKPMATYCENDLDTTILLFETLKPEIELREAMGKDYGIDLRSKSDAQVAEAVIKKSLKDRYGIYAKRPDIDPGTIYYYQAPKNLIFKTEVLQDVYRQYTTLPFEVANSGHVDFDFEFVESDRIKSGKNKGEFPARKRKLKFDLGGTKYTVGIGGLHSNEKSRALTNKNYTVREFDVASFYPRIILNNKLYPSHLGTSFLDVYGRIVKRRLHAKSIKDMVTSDSLKITINGSFGKLGSAWSVLYAPDLMMQVTITGQLSLLMLIERMELAGLRVASANTDGIIVLIPPGQEQLATDIIDDWEFDTGYDMEATDYEGVYSRDVNNYIGMTKDYFKGKGNYTKQSEAYNRLRKNPTTPICADSVKIYLREGVPVEKTIRACKDIKQFVSVRMVNGGAIKDGVKLGKAIRWYYATEELDAIHYITSGNKVPRTDGAVPLMQLPKRLPDDLDYAWYIEEANRMLEEIGA